MTARTDRLFVRPTFLSGVARVFDVFGTYDRYNVTPTPEEADARATASDWGMTLGDLRTTTDAVRERATAARQQLSSRTYRP